MIFFRPNDPWHFDTIGVSIFTLFRAATLEDWTDLMYISMFGCADFSNGPYVGPEDWTLDNRDIWYVSQASPLT